MISLDPSLHPMHPDYSGPTSGFFTCIHHNQGVPVEWTSDIMARVKIYREGKKPKHEIPARSAAMMWVDTTTFPGLQKHTTVLWCRLSAMLVWATNYPNEYGRLIAMLLNHGVTWTKKKGIDFERFGGGTEGQG